MATKQDAIAEWVVRTFGEDSFTSDRERSLRFIEEAIELVQAVGYVTENEIYAICQRKYSRPAGVIDQEIGGVFVTFLALCANQDHNAEDCLKKEWKRINSPEAQEKLQRRQAEKLEEGF